MSYSIESITADCYPGSAVLINLLDIQGDGARHHILSDIRCISKVK